MRFTFHVFLLVAFALIAISGSVASAAESNPLNAQVGRMLRATETNNADSVDTEDRGFTTFLTEKVKAKLTDAKIKTWITHGKSDEQVMKALGIKQGLSRAQLEAHPQFTTLEQFQVKKWLKEGATTTKVWNNLGFNNVRGAVEGADGYRTYVQYVWALANKVIKYNRNGGTPPKLAGIQNPRELQATKLILEKSGFDEWTITQILHGITF